MRRILVFLLLLVFFALLISFSFEKENKKPILMWYVVFKHLDSDFFEKLRNISPM